MERGKMDKKRWDEVIEHAREMLILYQDLPFQSGWFGASAIGEAISLYEKGDRSKTLFERLENIE